MTAGPFESLEVQDVSALRVPRGDGSPGTEAVEDLREPLDGIVRALQRLSLHDSGTPEPTADSTRLLHLARSLAGELRGVVDALLNESDGRPSDRRARQEKLPVVDAFEDALALAGPRLAGRHVTVSCPRGLSITTSPDRLRDLLVILLVQAAREPGEVHVVAQRDQGEVVIVFAGLRAGAAAGRHLDRVQALAGGLGGRIDVVAHPDADAGIRVRLPQQRSYDDAASPGRTAAHPAA